MITQNPFTGRSSGSLANVTASSYLGKNVLKSKPLEVRNPQSEAQVNMRTVFSQAAKAAKAISSDAEIARRSARTGRNTSKTARAATVAAMLAVKTGSSPNFAINPVGIALAGSGISQQLGVAASIVTATKVVTISWPSIIPAGGLITDYVSVAAVNMDSGVAQSFEVLEQRSDLTTIVTLNSAITADSLNIAIFVMFSSLDGSAFDSTSSILAVPA